MVLWTPGFSSALDVEECHSGGVDSDIYLFVADVVKSFDTVDRSVLDRVLSSLGLPDWFRHAYFQYHAGVRLRFKLAAGLGKSWTRDGRDSSGVPAQHDVCCCSLSALVPLFGSAA